MMRFICAATICAHIGCGGPAPAAEERRVEMYFQEQSLSIDSTGFAVVKLAFVNRDTVAITLPMLDSAFEFHVIETVFVFPPSSAVFGHVDTVLGDHITLSSGETVLVPITFQVASAASALPGREMLIRASYHVEVRDGFQNIIYGFQSRNSLTVQCK